MKHPVPSRHLEATRSHVTKGSCEGERVLLVSNMYPSPAAPKYGSFVESVEAALVAAGIPVLRVVNTDPRKGARALLHKYLAFSLKALAAIFTGGYTQVHAHYLFPSGVIGFVAARVRRVPVVLFAHGSDVLIASWKWPIGALTRAVVRHADRVAVPSRHLRTEVVAACGAHPDRIEIIPAPVDDGFWTSGDRASARQRLGLERDGVYLLFAGALDDNKGRGLEDVLHALTHEAMSGVTLVRVGEGARAPMLDRLAASLGLSERVLAREFASRETLRELYRAVDAVVVPSRRESLGLVALEARSCGVPVVATAVGGLPEHVNPGVTGELYEPGDSVALTRALERVLFDPGPTGYDVGRGLEAYRREAVIDNLKRACRSLRAERDGVSLHIWIDITNSPHALFFEPVIADLKAAGHRVTVTARDYAQTLDLLIAKGIAHHAIGRHRGKNPARKAWGLASRSAALAAFAARRRFDVAFSHNSNDLSVAAWFLGIPHLIVHDYEHASASYAVNARLATRILVPEAIPPEAIVAHGAAPAKVGSFPGLKEHVYLSSSSECLEDTRSILGVAPDAVFAVVRPPATMAAYHPMENDLFSRVIARLGGDERVRMVVLPRTPEQRAELAPTLPDNAIVPERVLDGPSLIRAADLVVSAGGTMNREAAALGTPAYTVFAGTVGAVDTHLMARGALVCVVCPRDIAVERKPASSGWFVENRAVIIDELYRMARG